MAEPPQPDRFAFLHVDLNSFFASVEQQLHPEYRGRPLAVVPTQADTTCCIAASYEAKALGIKTGTLVGEAKRICPEIILVMGEHGVYADYSRRIAQAVERCCPVAHTPSIDEMVCELMGREQEPPRARRIALAIKQAIRDDVGESLRCSIGLAPNRFLAKIASDMQKPDGLIGLLPSQLPRAIAHLELRDIPGVGARTEARLNAKGIHTMPQLLALDRKGMHALWNSRLGRPALPLAARRGNRRRRRSGGLRRAEVPRPLAHPRPPVPHARGRVGRGAQAPAQGRDAPAHGAPHRQLDACDHPLRADPRAGCAGGERGQARQAALQRPAPLRLVGWRRAFRPARTR